MKAPVSNVNFGKTAADYLMHRAGFPKSLFVRLLAHDVGTQTIVDLGTGTGTLGRGFAEAGHQVIGIDPAGEMLEAARQLDSDLGLETRYVLASAEDTGLGKASADIVSAGQCWHWFDGPQACVEILRILKPAGKLIVAYYDWLPLKGNVVRQTEKLIESYNPDWKGGNQNGFHPSLFRDLAEGGFTNLESFTYDEPAIYSHEGWRGRIRASAGVAATMDEQRVADFDAELSQLLSRDFNNEPLSIPHRVFALIAQPKTQDDTADH